MRSLAERLRRVRVCCGDWSRVVTRGALAHGNTLGIFLDPPYDLRIRDPRAYAVDSDGLSAAARRWALQHGDDPRYRIVLAGYDGEHEMPETWRVIAWKANRAYGRAHGPTANSENRLKERIWLSPYCMPVSGALPDDSAADEDGDDAEPEPDAPDGQLSLFGEEEK